MGQILGTKTKIQAMATERYRKNSISSLTTVDGISFDDDPGKEAILFQAYKERLGTSNTTGMKFDLQSIIRPIPKLE